jgi:hypothetical protein
MRSVLFLPVFPPLSTVLTTSEQSFCAEENRRQPASRTVRVGPDPVSRTTSKQIEA